MRLTIEKHGKGYSVRENGFAGDYNETLCAASTIDEALAFIRECMNPPVEPDPRGEPEGEGEKGGRVKGFINAWPEPTPTDPPWKRAKVGSWIKAYLPEVGTEVNAEVIDIRSVYDATTPCFKAKRFGGEVVYVAAERITAVLPTPPRHGDFGSMGEDRA